MQLTAASQMASRPLFKLLVSWLLLCAAIALHVADEAVNDFLAVYNPVVLALRERMHWLPLPVYTFTGWIASLAIAICLLVSLSPFVLRGVRWIRPIVCIVSILMILNGIQHIGSTVLGSVVRSLHLPLPVPGLYSAPVLIAASVYVLVQLQSTKRPSVQTSAA